MSFKKIIKGISRVETFRDLLISLASILIALLLSGLIVYLIGESPLVALKGLLIGSFGTVRSFANTLSRTSPLIFTGLAVALAFRCGLFNIGAEGQLYFGGFFAAITAIYLGELPVLLAMSITIIVGILAGMFWGGIPGLLKAKFGSHEVIVTVMLNYVAIFFTSYMVNYPFKAIGGVPQTEMIPTQLLFERPVQGSQLTTSIFLALSAAVLVYIFLWKTNIGYEIRAVGENKEAALAGGIKIKNRIILAMAISGGLAALAGVTEVMGVHRRFIEGFSPDLGFTGIAVAVLGRNHPIGVILTAFLFGILSTGGIYLERATNVSSNIVVLIQGLVILFVAAPEIIKQFMPKKGV
ncbi:MAG: ABC transporter permease [Halanaerobiales bacterium]